MNEEDLVSDLLGKVREVQPMVTEEQALEVERAIRQKWGGDDVYIAKDIRRTARARAKMKVAVAVRGTTPDVAHEHGVTRRTLYRLLKKD